MMDAILCDCDEPGCKGKLHSIRQCPMCKKDVEYWQIVMSMVGLCLDCADNWHNSFVRSMVSLFRERQQKQEKKILDVILGDTKGQREQYQLPRKLTGRWKYV